MDHWLKSTFSSPLINYLGKKKESRSFEKSPILIGGCGRSGTTLLLAILSAHPYIWAVPEETDAFTHWKKGNRGLIPVRIDRFYRRLLMASVPSSAKRWCEKRPYNIRYIAEILEYFGPSARFIQIVRDPRAVCTSFHPSEPHQYWISIDRYVRDLEAGLPYRNHPQVLTIKFENLLKNTNQVIGDLLEFIDEPDLQEIKLWQRYATVRTHSAWRNGLYTLDQSVADKWKDPKHQERVREILSNTKINRLMEVYGYQ